MSSSPFTLTLSIQPVERGSYPVVARLADGKEYRGRLRLPTSDPDYQELATAVLSSPTPNEDEVIAFGQRLYDVLFTGPLYAALQDAQTTARAQQTTLRIILAFSLDLHEVAAIPWEFACADEAGLALFAEHALCRYLATTKEHPALTIPANEVLTVLVAAGPPLDPAHQATLDHERATVEAALAPWITAQQVRVLSEPQLSALGLQRRLRAEPIHLLHLVASATTDNGEPQVVLYGRDGEPESVTARQLGILLQGSTVRCMVLTVPQLGQVGTALTRSLPPVLLHANVPAVVAFQGAVDPRSTRLFAEEFYGRLVAGEGLDQCVQAGRKALVLQGVTHTEWGLLTFYSRTDQVALRAPAAPPVVDRDRERIVIAAQHAESTRLLHLRLKGFVGRVAERTAIRGLIDTMRLTGGYVLIQGLAGEGKSSLIAALIDEDGVTTTPHHFIALTPGREYQLSLLRAVIAQLILKHDLSITYFPEDSYPAIRDYFAVILKQIAAKGVEETIYVDGLDQLPLDLDGRRDLSFLPSQPPPGIVIVLGTRPDDTLKPLEPLHRWDYLLPHLAITDFQALLAARTPDLGLPVPAVERLYQALDRNALYLALSSDELQRTPSADVGALVQAMTANPGNLFQLTLDRLKQQNRLLWDRVLKPLLAVLVVAQEPLTQPMLRSLLKVDHDDLCDGLERLGGLIAESPEKRFFLYHLKFREFLHEPPAGSPDRPFLFPQDDLSKWHQQLATWCLPTEEAVVTIWEDTIGVEQERRWYARHHTLTHLAEGQQWKQLWAIIEEGHYGQAKCRFDPSTHLYSLDLDRARTATADHSSLRQLWQVSLLRLTIANRVNQWPDEFFPTMVRLGQQAEALRRVEALSDDIRKTHILTLLVPVVASSEIGLVWQRARVMADTIHNDSPRTIALSTLAAALANAGLLDHACTTFADARATADLIPHDWQRAPALCTIAADQATAGLLNDACITFTDARIATNAISNDGLRATALRALAQALASAGLLDDARTVTDTIFYSERKSQASSALAQALATAGLLEDARTIIGTIHSDNLLAQTLSVLAIAQATAGLLKTARITADAVTQYIPRASALNAIAITQMHTGLLNDARATFADARATADAITDARSRAEALSALAQAFATAGLIEKAHITFADARTITDAITNTRQRAMALHTLTIAQVHADLMDAARVTFDDARTTANAITDDGQQAEALSTLAQALATVGHIDHARTTVNAIVYARPRAEALSMIAQALTRSGHLDAARTTANAITNTRQRSVALCTIATAQATTGNLTDAHTTFANAITSAHAIADARLHAETLCAIATAQASVSQFAHARTTVDAIPAGWQRTEALRNLTISQAQANQFADAYTTACDITDEWLRIEALCAIATILAHASQFDKAHTIFADVRIIADAITDKSKRADILSGIAIAQAATGNLADARQTADAISHSRARAEAFSAIAAAQAATGNLADARQTADTISHDRARAEALSAIATAYATAGHFADARATADAITHNRVRAKSLRALAVVQATAGHFADARTTADAITDDGEHTTALSMLAVTLLHINRLQEACTLLMPLYRLVLLREQTMPANGASSPLNAIGQGLAQGFLDITTAQKNAESGHLHLLHALHDHGATAEAQTILIMAWQFAPTRDTLLARLPWITPWLAQDPSLLPAILDSFAWVDQQIAAMA